MPSFLQHFSKNWVRTLVHGTLQKKLLISRGSTSFLWFLTKGPTFCNIFLKIGSKPQCTVLCRKSCLSQGDREVLVVFQQMPYFLQHFSKNWVKTLVHGTLKKKLLNLEEIDKFWWFFSKCHYFLQHFSKDWVKTLVHGTLHKKLLISRRSTSFGGFPPNAILFATFF